MTARLVISTHAELQDLLADDHTQYLLLAGRAGGQAAVGGTGASEELNLRGTTNANLGLIRSQSPLVFEDTQAANALSAYFVEADPAQTFAAGFIGGGFNASPTVLFQNGLFIWEALRGAPTITSGVAPSFAAFALFQGLPVLKSTGTFAPLNALVLNAGPATENDGAGATLPDTATTGIINAAPQVRCTTSGDILTLATTTGFAWAPTFSTVAGSQVNFGIVRGLHGKNPTSALFQPSAGIEAMDRYALVDCENITFGSNVEKAVVRSALAAATNAYFMKNNGGAQSDFGAGSVFTTSFVQCRSNTNGLGLGAGSSGPFAVDFTLRHNGTRLEMIPLDTAGSDEVYWTFGTGATTLEGENFGGSGAELRVGFDRFAFGQTGAVGNQVGVFVAPARTTQVNGEWSDFLLTQAGNLTVNNAMGLVAAWTLNATSITPGTGSLTEAATLNIGGMTTSGLGSATTSALRHTGRRLARGVDNFPALTPSALVADVNDYAPATGNSMRQVIRVEASGADRTITGFDVQRTGDTYQVANIGGTLDVILAHQNVSSSASNRIISPTGADYRLGPNQAVALWHDPTTDRWRFLDDHTPGTRDYQEETGGVGTTSATLVNIANTSQTITLGTTGDIEAIMTVQASSSGGAPATGAWAISINSVDGTEISRYLSGTNDTGALVVQNVATGLAPGAYTVVGRFRRVSGTSTVNTDVAQLKAKAVRA